MDKELIKEMISYIKNMEVEVDSEWGYGREFEDLPRYDEDHGNDGVKPELYFKLKKLLEG